MSTRVQRSALLGMVMALALRTAAARELFATEPELAVRADHMILDALISGDDVIAGTQSGRVEVWSRQSGKPRTPLLVCRAAGEAPFPPTVQSLHLSPDGRQLAVVTSDGRLRVLRPGEPAAPPSLDRVVPALTKAVFIGVDTLLLADMRGELALLDLATGSERYRRQLDYDPIYALAPSPSADRVAVALRSSRIQIVDPQSGETQLVLEAHRDAVFALAWLSEHELVSAGKDKRLIAWDLRGEHPRSRILYAGDHYITALDADPATERLAVSIDEDRIGILRLSDATIECTLAGHSAPIQTLRFIDEGEALLSAGFDARLFVWRLCEPAAPIPGGTAP